MSTFHSAAELFQGLYEKRVDSLRATLERRSKLVRLILYAYVVLIACPYRYWPLESGVDPTWRFALNYAAAQGSAVASNTVFTMGPLSYLIFPQHVGGNLTRGVLFQTGLWVVLAAIFADIFFWAGLRLENLALFSVFFALATPLFWFDFVGSENLMLAGALMLLVVFQLRGGLARYLAALALVGFLPMFKLSTAMVGFTALAGFLVERVLDRRWKVLMEAIMIVVIPLAVAAALCIRVMPSVRSVLSYLGGTAEIIGGYSSAMSSPGSIFQLFSASEAFAVLGVLLWLQSASSPNLARFYVLLLAIPLFLSFKHGFVRQDEHIINFFCFVALALALVSLAVNLDKVGVPRVVALAILFFFVIWQDNVGPSSGWNLATIPSGEKSARMLWGVLRFDKLKQNLDSSTESFPEDSRIEPELVNLIGNSPVASLSNDFTNVAASRMQLELYPVVQRYSAYTPYLDRLNASWIREHGPRFLVFDGKSIDERDPWAETPAMWLEVYRWYDARFLGPRNLLLERRAGPRFTALETIDHFRMAFTGDLRLPASNDAVFWTMKCDYNIWGQLQKMLFRVPIVLMSVHQATGFTRSARVLPEVIVSPVLGNYLPSSISQFYAVFHPGMERGYSIDKVLFRTSRSWSYSSTCEVEILRPAR